MNARHSPYWLLIFLIALCVPGIALAKDQDAGGSSQKDTTQNSKSNKSEVLEGKVVDVIDGETLTVLVDKTKYEIRLLRIETPEKDQIASEKSKKALSDKVLGKTVQVVSYGQNTRGQILGTVKLAKTNQPKSYWLTSSTNVRHNNNCRYYQKSKGRPCGPNDGKPCKICGG